MFSIHDSQRMGDITSNNYTSSLSIISSPKRKKNLQL